MKIELKHWNEVKDEMHYPKEDNNNGYVWGIYYLDNEGCDVIEVEWFKTEQERQATIDNEGLKVVYS